MPRKINNKPPPKVMTWGKAVPVLVVSSVFDALGFMFDWFIFFGPALATIGCTVGANSFFGIDISGVAGKAVAAGCATGAGVAGFFGAGVIESFGIIMAMITSFAGWLAVLIILLVFNQRIFKENALWFGASLIVTEIPFVGSLPVITFAVWRMYSRQIKIEKAAFAKWKKENADAQLQERQRQVAQAQVVQVRAIQQQAANDATYNQVQAANDEKYGIPEDVREAA